MRYTMTALCVLGLAACGGGGDKSDAATADSLSRDLAMAQQDSTNPMSDTAATPSTPAAAAPAASTPKPAAPKEVAPKPKPVAPAPPPTLASGTTFAAAANDTVSSRTTKSGASMLATVGTAVKDAEGRVVIPAGSTVTILLTQFKSAPTKGGKETFSAKLTAVEIDGTSYPAAGTVDHMTYTLKGRGITGGTVGKVAGGAAAGAVLGGVIGGNTKGAVIGGVVGAAGGAAVANETGDQDITILPGAQVTFTLTEPFVKK
jgi:hypothetical protein